MSIQGSRSPQDRGVTPNLMVRGVNEAIEFYQRALGAELLYRGTMTNGMTLHAQLRVGTSFILLSDEIMSHEGMPTGSPLKLGGTSAILRSTSTTWTGPSTASSGPAARPWAK